VPNPLPIIMPLLTDLSNHAQKSLMKSVKTGVLFFKINILILPGKYDVPINWEK